MPFSLAKVTFLGDINFKISTEHQILMSTDCQDDMLSENITKDTMSSLQSPLSKKPKLHSFPTAFNHFFLKMSRKYVSEVNEKYALNQWEPFSYSCFVVISFHFLLQSSEFYWPFRLEICRDRRSCKIFVSCVNFSRKQRSFFLFCKFTHT